MIEKPQRTDIYVWSYKVILSSFFKLQIMAVALLHLVNNTNT